MAAPTDGSTIVRRRPWTVLATVLAAGYFFGVIARAIETEQLGIDFGVFHAGGSLINSQGYEAAYDNAGFSRHLATEYFPALAESSTVAHFISPPTFGWFAQGLTFWSFEVAVVIWLVVCAAALVPACRLLRLPVWSPAVLLLSPMMARNFGLGQTGSLMLLLFAGLHCAHVEGRLIRGGVLAGLLILKPPLAFGYGLLWLTQATRHRWSIVAAALTGIVVSIPTLTGGLRPWRLFLDSMLERTDAESAWSQQSSSLPEFLKLLLPLAPSYVSVASWLVGIAVAWGVLIAANRRFGSDAEFMSATAVVATVIASPHLLVYDSLILVVPVAVAYRRGLLTGDRAGLLAAITTASFAFGPAVYELQYGLVGRGIGLEFPALVLCSALLVRWNDEGPGGDGSLLPVLPDSTSVDREREDLVVSE